MSETEWRRRFREAREAVGGARAALAQTKVALDGAAVEGGANQWAVAPPTGGSAGGGASGSPLSFKLRQELKKNREDLEGAERALRDLEIEANLAGVPVLWRGTPEKIDEAPSEVGQLRD